ncbi:MAG: hypothetical protein H0V32_05305 [Nocardioidaceae bacterium]|nr:hypothetical protein [Nocardioidaceae bacterium]
MSDQAYWWVVLGLGLVVAVVVVVLLQAFLNEVHRIERGAGQVWQAGKQVAGNTATTWLLDETASRLDDIVDEAGRHGRLLGGEPAQSPAPTPPQHRATGSGSTAAGAR